MKNPQIKVVDISTGIETITDMTDEQMAQWESEKIDKQVLISVDDILLNQPGLLMRHERHLLDDVYEDDLFYPNINKNQFFSNSHTYEK
jgi:hypothetical protein